MTHTILRLNCFYSACLIGGLVLGCDDGTSTSSMPVAVAGSGGEGAGGAEPEGGAGGTPTGGLPMGGSGGAPVGGMPVGGAPMGGMVEGGSGGAPMGGEPVEPVPLPGPDELPRFAMPVEQRELIRAQFVIGVDHLPMESNIRTECINHEGRAFPGCYAGHDGTDFILAGGFRQMDDGSATVVAAAGGEVIRVVDGNYDRCHADLVNFDVSCDGNPIRPNFVGLRHANGWTSWYFHLKKDSILVEEGDEVPCGAPLGLIGSSGYSSSPHLHFEVDDPDGQVWDPYSGPESQVETLWAAQVTDDELPGGECDGGWGQVP
ncbi:MAG: M23 family metallopeptidase [Bradymonadia bacterium]